jgi:NAD(P)H-dependent FMN reductase
MSRIAVVTGSTRVPRVGDHVANWVRQVLEQRPSDELKVEPLVIADFNLPVFDEPAPPASIASPDKYTKEHSRRWGKAVADFQGFVFVVPEYNYGLAGGTKNALDYVFNELKGKPAAIISYGVMGGSQANAQLSNSLGIVVKMKVAETKVLLPFAGTDIQATATGTLGEESVKAWEEKKEDILKAFAEIKTALAESSE